MAFSLSADKSARRFESKQHTVQTNHKNKAMLEFSETVTENINFVIRNMLLSVLLQVYRYCAWKLSQCIYTSTMKRFAGCLHLSEANLIC